MGLLKGAGSRLRGLFGEGGLLDNLEAAQAWLEGDYGRGLSLTERNRRRKRRPGARDAEKEIAPGVDPAFPPYGERHEAWHVPSRFGDR